MPEPHQGPLGPRRAPKDDAGEDQFRRKVSAYYEVFGAAGGRTSAQELVMRDLEHRGYINHSTMVPNKEGLVQDMKMEAAEGMRIMILETKNFIRLGQEAITAKSSSRAVKK